MVLKTRSCNLLTIPSKSSPSAAIIAAGRRDRQWPQQCRYVPGEGVEDSKDARRMGR